MLNVWIAEISDEGESATSSDGQLVANGKFAAIGSFKSSGDEEFADGRLVLVGTLTSRLQTSIRKTHEATSFAHLLERIS